MKQTLWFRIWSFTNVLSLDVVLGAMGGMYFFQRLFEVIVGIEFYILLGIAVWSIYTTDHLLDASNRSNAALSLRHEFHRKYRKVIVLGLIFALPSALLLVILSPSVYPILIPALFLAAGIAVWYVLLYFKRKKVSFLKELMTAFFYIVGIAFAPLLLSNEFPEPMQLLLAFLYFLLALINLLILSYFDRRYDQLHAFASISGSLDSRMHERLCFNMLNFTIGVLLISLVLAFSYFKIYLGILLLIAVVHYTQLKNGKSHGDARRVMEVSFSLPWLLLLF
ncbi:hypothetical protein [Mongoliitalea daihaiensis]|uniref:hypothetical protein n=1 Tax=Mongoliitalea daihaiensis TaxID=2782006 RepID=UPI001F2B18E4|nr:hypothetical protein [Mongoliitalea daihaiensis]UJP66293.1 hypothetical protein IPZ59_06655 [Mongoliitalea daihaiensis]